jgi:hypothetical protein
VSRDGGRGPVSNGGRSSGNWMQKKLATAECVLGGLEKTSGVQKNYTRAQAGAGASAARVAAVAELGQEQCDVEDAEQGSTGSVGRRRSSEWHVGSSGGRR